MRYDGTVSPILSRPILERIHHKVVMMMQDTKLMANELMRKAVNYTINQWKSLKNILKDGAAEISNNLCEQRMKPVKLLLKNCMDIGSEDAAKNSAGNVMLLTFADYSFSTHHLFLEQHQKEPADYWHLEQNIQQYHNSQIHFHHCGKQ